MAQAASSEIAVVGAGPAGIAAALALAHSGAAVTLIGPAPVKQQTERLDARTAALLENSIDMLRALGVFEKLRPFAAPLKAIRIVDASDSLIRSPDLHFSAGELGREAFGYNIANSALVDVLYAAAATNARIRLEQSPVERITLSSEAALLELKNGTSLSARLVVGADGRHSVCRKAAGIAASERSTGKAAIASSFAHGEPHRGVSYELHRAHGSVTTVPLTDPCASSLVWIGENDEVEFLMKLEEANFARELQARLDRSLGLIGEIGVRSRFPIAPLTVELLAARRTALIGEAAHVLAPIGAQGLNLGFRDAAALADCVATALTDYSDPGGDAVLRAYQTARRLDVATRSLGIDFLSRSLLTDFLPLQAARGLVSHGLNALPALRKLVMRIGMTPPTELPSLMRR